MLFKVPPSHDSVIEIRNVTRQFGAKRALDDISLVVPRGQVVGLIGANGAGKTTLIRHILGMLRAQSGTVRVFGLDPVQEPVRVLSRIGYLSEEGDLPAWMRIDELMRYMRAFYPTWDEAYAQELRRQFELDPAARVRSLSKGQKARAGLVVALAFRPELLLLDEPSSGLDPIVRRDILGAIVRTIADEGRTVVFSSHLLDDVERISDRVAMLKGGRVLFAGELDDIKQAHYRVTFRFEDQRRQPPDWDGVLSWQGSEREWTAVAGGEVQRLALAASALGAQVVRQQTLSLDEIFLAHASRPLHVPEEVQP